MRPNAPINSSHQLADQRPSNSLYTFTDQSTTADNPTAGGVRPLNHVNEPGLHAPIFGSTKPEANRFKLLVTSEAQPARRCFKAF